MSKGSAQEGEKLGHKKARCQFADGGLSCCFCFYVVGWWTTLVLSCVVLVLFHFVAGLKEFHQTVDQFLAAANHVQAVFALMLVQ
jgi:hypothetical protein